MAAEELWGAVPHFIGVATLTSNGVKVGGGGDFHPAPLLCAMRSGVDTYSPSVGGRGVRGADRWDGPACPAPERFNTRPVLT